MNKIEETVDDFQSCKEYLTKLTEILGELTFYHQTGQCWSQTLWF